ncbi:DUF2694 domain-containing protein [Williamsia sp. CHRR-6]|uniref:DUF2694 domain-containing protein n=1 Tax=Williamsia sp. CHRR-6 TaxID=2835871 RepID=UPI001BDACCA1|nr:DUF2694 domain-containing protein [Williamsia sp. CHRR-6]MBT0568569.1 hypothetical protein [Williamsia sp. CHRR-6]
MSQYDNYYEEDDEYADSSPAPDADAEPDAQESQSEEWSLKTVGRATNPTGSVEVRTTEQGLPTAIRIEKSEMDKPAATLARTILLLCQQAGKRAAAAHRKQLLAEGHSIETLSYLDLPTEREAADFDLYVDSQIGDSEPDTWMRRV